MSSVTSNTPILDELIEYADLCLRDVRVSKYEDYISCKKHKHAVKRFLKDVERAKDPACTFEWDEREAQKIVDWFGYLRHSKGVLAGKHISLTTWQKFVMCQLYGWRMRDTGCKRFHKLFVEVGRKNAKSQMIAGVLLYEIAVASTRNREIYEAYTTGVKRDQAKIIFNECNLMLAGSPLRTKFKITNNQITHMKTGSFLKTLSKDDKKTGDGTNPAVLSIDEFHQHPTDEFLDLFLGANTKDPTLIIITTAGMDLSYPCYTVEYKYVSDILNPDVNVEADDYLIDILEVDLAIAKDMKKLANERYWHMANPIRMSYEDGQDKIRKAFKEAMIVPEKMTAFLTKMLNVWVQARQNGYMDMGKWSACEITEDEIPIDTTGMEVYVGVDLSAKIDLTSVAFVVPYQDQTERDRQGNPTVKYLVWTHSFIPNLERLQEHILKDKQPYDAWERMGFLTITDTPIVDQSQVIEYVLNFVKEHGWKIACWCFDPANASLAMMQMSDEGYDVEEVYQSHKSLNESTSGFREQVYAGNVYHIVNPLFNYSMGNAVVRQNNGLIKIDKDATTKRIDPVDATLCGYKLAMYHEFNSSFVDAIDAWLKSEW